MINAVALWLTISSTLVKFSSLFGNVSGENLPIPELEKTVFHTGAADVALVLGTSMRVSPANQFPVEIAKRGGKMIIVNLQKTPYDNKADLILHEQTDKVMQLLFKYLELEMPVFTPDMDPIKGNQR